MNRAFSARDRFYGIGDRKLSLGPLPLLANRPANADDAPAMSNADQEESTIEQSETTPHEVEETPVTEDSAPDEAGPTDESPAGEETAPDGKVTADDEEEADESAEPGKVEIIVNLPVLEALIFSTHHPLTAGRLAELMDLPTSKPIRKAIRELNQQYESSGRAWRIEQVAGGFQMLTLPDYGFYLQKLHQREADAKLTKAALETLAIVAYKQPILRVDVEAIRGVACGEAIRGLMEKRLVTIAGRAEEPGRPILYGTTKRFLELFGLNSLKDLPKSEADLKKME